jgi:hypothetical protein
VLEADAFDLVHVLARGKRMVRDGSVAVREKFLEESNRQIRLRGDEENVSDGVAEVMASQL